MPDRRAEAAFPRALFPTTDRQVRTQIRYDRWVRRACRDRHSRIVGHMSTADTARDMDLVRQAVGDDQLTYYGVSYGTQLGTTYAALFPDRVRAMVLDGVLDPEEWTVGHGDASTRLSRSGSAAATAPGSRSRPRSPSATASAAPGAPSRATPPRPGATSSTGCGAAGSGA